MLDGAAVRDVVLHFRRGGYEIEVPGGRRIKATQATLQDGTLIATLDGARLRATAVFDRNQLTLLSEGRSWRLELDDPIARAGQQEGGSGRLTAPMPGLVVAVLVEAGQRVERDQPLMLLEAMKMEHTIRAPAAGRIAQVNFAVGQQVTDGAELLNLEIESA